MTDKAKQAEEFKKANAGENKTQERDTADGKKEYLDEDTNEWVGKNELKNRQKLKKKAQAVAEKAAKKAEEEKKAGPKPAGKKAAVEEELDPSKYTENRKNFLQGMRDEGKNPYPHKFNRDMTIP